MKIRHLSKPHYITVILKTDISETISLAMTVAKKEGPFSFISVKELHPTFAAEISGVDFSLPLSDEVFREIFQAVTKVSSLSTLSCTEVNKNITVRSCHFPHHWSDR